MLGSHPACNEHTSQQLHHCTNAIPSIPRFHAYHCYIPTHIRKFNTGTCHACMYSSTTSSSIQNSQEKISLLSASIAWNLNTTVHSKVSHACLHLETNRTTLSRLHNFEFGILFITAACTHTHIRHLAALNSCLDSFGCFSRVSHVCSAR